MHLQFKTLRQKMVACQIRPVDVTDLGLLEAFLTIERENFISKEWQDFSYCDMDISSAQKNFQERRFMLRPASLAKLLQLLHIQKSDKILVIGAGSGYSSAILSLCAHAVIALEEDEALLEMAKENLPKSDFPSVEVVSNPLENGYTLLGPYDAIFIEGCVEAIPEEILAQLKEGGRLVCVVGDKNLGEAIRVDKVDNVFSEQGYFSVAAPLLSAFKKKINFQF